MTANTLFLRLEGPLQAWGDHRAKFLVRRTMKAPTKSGVIGLICAVLGVSRFQASRQWLPPLAELEFGVRIDRPGVRWWDYHTVGAGLEMRTAAGVDKTRSEVLLTQREYLCDASFLVALRGESDLIAVLWAAMQSPVWPPYLGRKSCPPSRPISEHPPGFNPNLYSALTSVPWRPRLRGDEPPKSLDLLLEWRASAGEHVAPKDAEVAYDVPMTFDPPSHSARFVVHERVALSGLQVETNPLQRRAAVPPRPRADYTNSEYRRRREERLQEDEGLCVFCKAPATTVQHVTYRRAGGKETAEDLRSLCRLCHDAITMIEYGLNMGLDRINPEESRWRETIVAKRDEIVRFRSIETRRRRLSPEEVE